MKNKYILRFEYTDGYKEIKIKDRKIETLFNLISKNYSPDLLSVQLLYSETRAEISQINFNSINREIFIEDWAGNILFQGRHDDPKVRKIIRKNGLEELVIYWANEDFDDENVYEHIDW